MATLAEVLADACTSEIGKVNNPVTLLQVSAQLSADYLVAADPGADISVEAIMSRACDSGIAKVENPDDLLRIIAQLLLDQQA